MPLSDEQLRAALAREAPPKGFERRVLARAEQLDVNQSRSIGWGWAAAAVITIATASTAYEWQTRLLEGQRAKAQVLVALRITGEKLHSAHAQVQESGQRQIEVSEP